MGHCYLVLEIVHSSCGAFCSNVCRIVSSLFTIYCTFYGIVSCCNILLTLAVSCVGTVCIPVFMYACMYVCMHLCMHFYFCFYFHNVVSPNCTVAHNATDVKG